MNQMESVQVVDLLRELWPSKSNWTKGMVGLWVEKLARPEFNRNQVEAVVRQIRSEEDYNKPSMKRIIGRCFDVHRVKRDQGTSAEFKPLISPEQWAVIHADREAAAAWFFELRKHPEDLAAVVAEASSAYPVFAKSKHIPGVKGAIAFERFLDLKFHPSPIQCMFLKCGWQAYQDHGAWKPLVPSPAASTTAPPTSAP